MRFLKSFPALLASLIGAVTDLPMDGIPAQRRIGAGKARALSREGTQRLRQANRLKNASPPQTTRQQRRALERKARATRTPTPTQKAYLNMRNHFPNYPKSTFVR